MSNLCGSCGGSAADKRSASGFTLMEMLVTLILISFATMLMFQMLGSYRIASERVGAQAGEIDREALFQAWFRDSVHGLYAAPNLHFVGDESGFSATTLNPLYAAEGSPSPIAWELRASDSGAMEVAYVEGGVERWSMPVRAAGRLRFAYYDEAGAVTDAWPPKLGKVNPEALPALVGLVREDAEREKPLLAAVLGPLEPPKRLYGEEQLE